jgi:hypothetical protein
VRKNVQNDLVIWSFLVPTSMTGPPPPEDLSTWKEIAEYLGVSIREAQYREKNDGLPIRRLEGKKPRVWALRPELDSWKMKRVPAAAGPVPPAPNAPTSPGSTSSSPVEERPGPTVKWGRRAVLGAVGLGVAATAARLVLRAREPRVERAVLTGNLLTALDGLGGSIWKYRFSGDVQDPTPGDSSWRVQVADLEGAGSPGVLAVVRRNADSTARAKIDEISYFAPDGRLRWTLPCRPDLLDFDGKRFEPVWWCCNLVAVPFGKQQTIWVGVNHGWRWPGCVMRIDAKGASTLQFANSGHIEMLCRLTRPNGQFIAVAGENNAFDRSCAAVLAVDDPASRSPDGGAARCHFANPPSGAPRDYVLLPTTEMLKASDMPYGLARLVTQTDDGGFMVHVQASDSPNAELLYQFSGATGPGHVMPSGGCPATHRHLEEKGRLNHTWAACPEVHRPLTVRHWRPKSGWQDEEFPWRAATDSG